MADYGLMLAALLALLLGLALGKAWERYKLRDGRWIDRRKLRDSPHYVQGLNYLLARQIDLAIEEIGKAAGLNQQAVEIQVLLGNLYREKGQVSRAIQTHQQLLQRPQLTRQEQGSVLLCLGLDYSRAGFVDRAVEAFSELLRLDPDNRYALLNLEKLHEDQHQWSEAYAIRQRLAALAPPDQQSRHQTILAFLEDALGQQAFARGDLGAAAERFLAAIDLDAAVVPAYHHLGDVYQRQGRLSDAAATWERAVAVAPERAYLAFDRLSSAYAQLGEAARFAALCRRLIAESPQDWRAHLALAKFEAGEDRHREAFALLLQALSANPHAITVHQAMWHTLSTLGFEASLVDRYVEEARQAVFYQDPHVCLRCHYRSTELLWQCPHCHEWNAFVEERLTPAREADGDSTSASV
jgi:lipopolysaccharide biosynthesis regulator YciM